MNQAPSSQRSSLCEGTIVAHYRLIERLGEGGMGVVFKAEDTKLRRVVALKLLHPSVAQDPDKKRRFLREGRLAAHLSHPCLATIHQVGEADGRIFIAMELCEGRTLKSLLQGRPGMPYLEALHVLREVTRGLRKAHDAGVIHRDLKPDNVMVGEDGIVKILDFGVAKPLETLETDFTDIRTQHGTLVGTPSYMSPEQATGKRVDARSDIFSVGVLLYEVLTGRRPFRGETWQDIIISINRDAPQPACAIRPDLPPEVDLLLDRCMAKRAADRYASCRELLEDIDRLQASAGMLRSGVVPALTGRMPPPAGSSVTPQPLARETPFRLAALTTPSGSGALVAPQGRKAALVVGALAAAALAGALAVGLGRRGATGAPEPAALAAGTAEVTAAPGAAAEPLAATAPSAAPSAPEAPAATPPSVTPSAPEAPASTAAAGSAQRGAPAADPARPPRPAATAAAPKPGATAAPSRPPGAATAAPAAPTATASAKPKNSVLGF